jgi:hypothetical protein
MIIGPLDLQAAHQDAVSINSLRRAILINVYADSRMRRTSMMPLLLQQAFLDRHTGGIFS